MYIRRKVFSVVYDETTGEEKLFSVNEIINEEAYLEQHQFSEEKKEGKKIALSKVDSNRGLGRSLFLGGLPGAYAAHAGKKAANKADEEGKSDSEIIDAAAKAGKKRGMKVGAAIGALGIAGGAASGHSLGKVYKRYTGKYSKDALARGIGRGTRNALIAGALTTGAGYLGAKKNAKRRIEKRATLERD